MYYRREEKDRPLAVFNLTCPKCGSSHSSIVVRKRESSGCLFFIFPFLWKDSSYYAICNNCNSELSVNQEKMEGTLGNYGVGRGFLQSDSNIPNIKDPNIDDNDLFS